MKKSKIETEKGIKLFQKKYPTGGYWFDEEQGRFNVYFKEGGKVYGYRATNTLQLIRKLKIVNENVMYNKDYKQLQNSIEKQKKSIIEIKTEPDDSFIFLFSNRNDCLKEAMQKLQKMENDLANAVVLDI